MVTRSVASDIAYEASYPYLTWEGLKQYGFQTLVDFTNVDDLVLAGNNFVSANNKGTLDIQAVSAGPVSPVYDFTLGGVRFRDDMNNFVEIGAIGDHDFMHEGPMTLLVDVTVDVSGARPAAGIVTTMGLVDATKGVRLINQITGGPTNAVRFQMGAGTGGLPYQLTGADNSLTPGVRKVICVTIGEQVGSQPNDAIIRTNGKVSQAANRLSALPTVGNSLSPLRLCGFQDLLSAHFDGVIHRVAVIDQNIPVSLIKQIKSWWSDDRQYHPSSNQAPTGSGAIIEDQGVVYLASIRGQSNAGGRGLRANSSNYAGGTNINGVIWDGSSFQSPITENNNGSNDNTMFGIELDLARVFEELTGYPLHIVKSYVDGSNAESWEQGQANYNAFENDLRNAIDTLENQGYTVVYLGEISIQGETDGLTVAGAVDLAGQLTNSLDGSYDIRPRMRPKRQFIIRTYQEPFGDGLPSVRADQQSVADARSDRVLVDIDDFATGAMQDQNHWQASVYEDIGVSIAKELSTIV